MCYWRFRRQLLVFRWHGTFSESSALCPRSDQKFFKVIANVYLDIRKAPDVNAERTGESLVFGTLDGPSGAGSFGSRVKSKWEFSWQIVMVCTWVILWICMCEYASRMYYSHV